MPLSYLDFQRPDVLTGVLGDLIDVPALYTVSALAPLRRVTSNIVEVNLSIGTDARIGQFRAMNGQTPVSMPRINQATTRIELPIQAEMEPQQEDYIRMLQSPDTGVQSNALALLVDAATRLNGQNARLSTYMVWQALMDTLTLTYPVSGGSFDIRYDLANTGGGMGGSHILQGPVTWLNVNADIIADVAAAMAVIQRDAHVPAVQLWIGQALFNAIRNNVGVQRAYGTTADPRRPQTVEQLADVLGIQRVVLYTETYEDKNGATQLHLAANTAIFVSETVGLRADQISPIALLNGPIAAYDRAANDIRVYPVGPITDLWVTQDPPKRNVRVQTARIPAMQPAGVVRFTATF